MSLPTDNLPISDADFSGIKLNFTTWLQNQTTFQDYNFTGSAISTLLDILAYNSHYNAAHVNMSFAEAFLDSAQLPGSVYSRAAELAYVPRSITAAKATVTISFSVTGNPAQYTIPKGTSFISSAGGTSYPFVLTEDVLINNVGNVFTATIDLYQGQYTTYTYTVNLQDASQRFIVPATNADMNFLTVLYKANTSVSDSLYAAWSDFRTVNIGEMTSASTMYFLKRAYDSYYEVYFGDGNIGQALTNGNVIQLQYLLTSGDAANGASSFTMSSTLTDTSNVTISTVTNAQGGAVEESTDSIKYLAPFYYASQGRAVTKSDYKALVKAKYANVSDVAVWGGETNVPPTYGSVYIAIVPNTETTLSTMEKQSIATDIIAKYSIVGITPIVTDPDYIKVGVSATVLYNDQVYNPASSIDLNTTVQSAITTFFSSSVNKFGQDLYYSQLVDAIDASSTLITGATVNLTLEKQTPIFSGVAGTYTFSFNNGIYPGSISSNTLVISGQNYNIKDIPTAPLPYTAGVLAIYKTNTDGSITYLNSAAGTVDYQTGVVTLSNVQIDSIVEDPIFKNLAITVAPGPVADPNNPTQVFLDQNVYTNAQDQIITLNTTALSVTLLPDGS